MENTINYENGTQSQSIEPSYNGGELMPVNQANENGCTPLEMAASIGITMAVGYGLGKLGELLFDKVIGPTSKKVAEKFDKKMAKKNKKGKPKVEEDEGEVIDGEFTEMENDPDEDQDEEEQSPEKKVIRGSKSIKNAAKNKRRR